MVGPARRIDAMTSRQRLLAAYRGQPVDRLPYWAKVTNPTWRTSQPDAIRQMSDFELLDYILADGIFACPHGVRRIAGRVSTECRRDGNLECRVTRTPDGDLTETWAMDPRTQSWHPAEFPVKSRQDIARFRWAFTEVRYATDEQRLEQSRQRQRQIADRGVSHTAWGTSPMMDLVEHVIGPVNVHLMLADCPAEMDELIGLMHADCLARARAVAENTAADIVVSVENTSTTLISPVQFERYCFGHLADCGAAIESAGKMHELHMCGHLKALLGRIDAIPAASVEAFTTPTLGNTHLADGRAAAPSKTLVGGTNVNVWLMPVERIESYILEELSTCPNHRRIVLTTAGVAPPGCPADTFRQIGQWIATVPVRM